MHLKGTKKDKLAQINAFVWEKFQDARKKQLPVETSHLKDWALEKGRSVRILF